VVVRVEESGRVKEIVRVKEIFRVKVIQYTLGLASQSWSNALFDMRLVPISEQGSCHS